MNDRLLRFAWALVALSQFLDSRVVAQQPVNKFESLFQGRSDEHLLKTIDAIYESLPAKNAEAAVSRLPFGQMVHIRVPALKDFRALTSADDPKIVGLEELPSTPLERNVGNPNYLPAHFLSVGAARQRPVARIRLKKAHATEFGSLPAGSGWGTGFLVADNLLMTNNHVLQDSEFCKKKARLQFNFQVDLDGSALPVDEYDLDPDGYFYTNRDLDFTVVRVKPKPRPATAPAGGDSALLPQPPGAVWGHIRLSAEVQYAERQPVNIIQHPAGRFKEVVLHENEITTIAPRVIRYKADTEPGSSGSPVFDNEWNLVALHHSAGEKSPGGAWLSNEGVRIDVIIDDLRNNSPAVISELGVSR